MSASYEWTEWHLTPGGWMRGSERTDCGREEVEPPLDRVLTVRYIDEHNGYSARQSHSEEWRSQDSTAVHSLLDQYGPVPARL